MTPLQLVLAGTALEIAYFLFEVPTGVVADPYCRKASVVAGILLGPGCVVGAVPGTAAGRAWPCGAPAGRSAAAPRTRGSPTRPDPATARRGVQARRPGRPRRRPARHRGGGRPGPGRPRLPFVAAGCTAVALAFVLAAVMHEHGFTRPERVASDLVAQGLPPPATGPVSSAARRCCCSCWGSSCSPARSRRASTGCGRRSCCSRWACPSAVGLGDVAWFGILAAATLVLSFAVAGPLVRRWRRSHARLARLLLVLHGVLMLCALGFALAGSLWPRGRGVPRHVRRTQPHRADVPDLAQRHHHGLVGAGHRPVDHQRRGAARGSGAAGRRSASSAPGGASAPLSRPGLCCSLPTLLLFARAVRHHGVEPELATHAG